MKRILLSIFVLCLAVLGMQAQLLWKVESPSGNVGPSYIVGTYHLAPGTMTDSIAGLRQALAETEQMYGELEMGAMKSPEAMQAMIKAMMLPQGTTLSSLFDETTRQQLDALLKEYLGAGLDNPGLNAMSPMAVMSQLVISISSKAHPESMGVESFDTYLQTEAKALGKPVYGLETTALQVDILFGMPLPRQTEQLEYFILNEQSILEQAQATVAAYFHQDLPAMFEASMKKFGNKYDSTPEEEDKLIYNRNKDWAEKLTPIFQQEPTLVAVGAGHLPGERGLLELLRKAGFKVTEYKANK